MTGAAHGPDTGSYEGIHLGGHAAVVVPVADFMRLRALERLASAQELEDAGDTAAQEWRRGRQRARPPACPPARYGSGWA